MPSPASASPVGLPLPGGPRLRVVPQQLRGVRKLTHILDSADRIMATHGWDAVTTTRVAGAAGVSVGTLYRYLPHREAIFEALIERHLSELTHRLESGFDEPEPASPAGVAESTQSPSAQRPGLPSGSAANLVGAKPVEAAPYGPSQLMARWVVTSAQFYRQRPGLCSLRFFGPTTRRIRELDAVHRQRSSAALREALISHGIASPGSEVDQACDMVQVAMSGVLAEAFRSHPRGDRQVLKQLHQIITTIVARLPAQAAAEAVPQ